MKLVPADIIEESRTKAVEATSKPTSNLAAAIIVFIWVLCAAGCAYWVF